MSYPFTLDLAHADDNQACFMVTLAGLALVCSILGARLIYLGILRLLKKR